MPKHFFALLLGVFLFAAQQTQAAEVAPPSVPGAETISVEKAKQLHDEGVLFIDLRMIEDYEIEHITGAQSLAIPTTFNEDTLAMMADKNQPIVFYCYGVNCMRSYTAATSAVGWGYTQIKYFRGGLPAWIEADLPTD